MTTHHGPEYHVDIVFVIDLSHRMCRDGAPIKNYIRSFHDALSLRGIERDYFVTKIRSKVVTYGDPTARPTTICATDFLTLVPELDRQVFELYVDSLASNGVGTRPNTGLEALVLAMSSDWARGGDRRRHVIVMFADTSAAQFDHGTEAPRGPTANIDALWLDDLSSLWDSLDDIHARRLFLIAPDTTPWSDIGDSLEDTAFIPLDLAIELDADVQQVIIDMVWTKR